MSERPNPDELLARVKADEARQQRGKLKVFFGYAAGVGKTFAMLLEARRLAEQGVDVVVGYVEPHGRPETEALLEGLEQLPTLAVPYRNTVLQDFDLDAALARKPEVILVDELAHSNASGMRHPKRWQDVEELIAAGINVKTTMNVQHVESLNDVVARISGIVVRETVPDDVIFRADELSLVDLPPDELIERLRQGKVYIPAQAKRAMEYFFRRENLMALREMALRRTAERVHVDVETARSERAATVPWPTSDRLLVCVGPSPTSAQVIRAAKRLADTMQSPWIALSINTPRTSKLSAVDRQRLLQHLQLAERLGAEVVHLTGDGVAGTVIEYASGRNVTKIVVGKTQLKRRPSLWRAESIVDGILRDSGNIDVYVVRGIDEPVRVETPGPRGKTSPLLWLKTVAVVVTSTAVAWLFHRLGFSEANLVMIYLLGVVAVATLYGRSASIVATVLSVAAFDVLFTYPYFSITVQDGQYLVTFLVMLLVGIAVSQFASRSQQKAKSARNSERRTEALYRLSRQLTTTFDKREMIVVAEKMVSDVFSGHAILFLPDESGRLRPILGHAATFAASAREFAVAQWVFDHKERAGIGTDTLPDADAHFVPLVTPNGIAGVLAFQPTDPASLQEPETRQLLETYASQIGLALERYHLGQKAHRSELLAETEKLRSTLLSSISHDLRTPLAVIAGTTSSLLQENANFDDVTRREMLQAVYDEADRLSRLVTNLLRLTQLTSGKFQVQKEWHPVEDVIGSSLHHLRRDLKNRQVSVELPPGMPMGQYDSVLIEQVLVNLLENAARYTPEGTPIHVRVFQEPMATTIEVVDEGPGLSPGEEKSVFDNFQRGERAQRDSRGAGLGLAICRAIIEAHGGSIDARNREHGGAAFRVRIPFDEPVPSYDFATNETLQ